MTINGKIVNIGSLSVESVDFSDYPKFTDAFISSGKFEDGTEMTDSELDMISDDIVNDLAHQQFL